MTAEALLSRLKRVKKTSPGNWRASCPGPLHEHGDRHPGLIITEKGDGRVLLYCYAGCSVPEIVAGAGLGLDALFPQNAVQSASERRNFKAADILETIAFEALIVAVAASNVRLGITLSTEDRERLLVAAERLETARRMANG